MNQSSNLPILQNITKFNHTVTRILAQNPGPYTLQGTNTYLISGSRSSFLIDTGQGLLPYIPFLESVLKVNPPVSDIILTHYHSDHVNGISSVLESIRSINKTQFKSSPDDLKKPKIWKYKLSSNLIQESSKDTEQEEIDTNLIQTYSKTLDEQDEYFERLPIKDSNGKPQYQYMNWLKDGQTFEISNHSNLKIIHTPGHTNDSISCALYSNQSNPTEAPIHELNSIFVGDTILGGSTSVFDNLTEYLKSLEKLKNLIQTEHPLKPFDLSSIGSNLRLYPGHGDVIEDGLNKINQYIKHRIEREKEILGLLPYEPDSSNTEELMKLIYKGKLAERVIPAALRGLRLHLRKLVNENEVKEIEEDQWTRLRVDKDQTQST
ncbi:beta-lactamase-like protein [Melampsora americana]|nr:beta-lactamase-like protein [Melampsora americana]